MNLLKSQILISRAPFPIFKFVGFLSVKDSGKINSMLKSFLPCVTQRQITALTFFANNKIRREMGLLSLSAEFFDFKGPNLI